MADPLPSDRFMRAILRDILGRAIMGDHSPRDPEEIRSEHLCPYCKGLGKVQYYHGDLDTCPTCHGAGYVGLDEPAPYDWNGQDEL